MKKRSMTVGTIALMAMFAINTTSFGQNLIKNANFASWVDGKPSEWTLALNKQEVFVSKKDAPEGGNKALGVKIVTDGGKSLGEIRQNLKITPGAKYKFSGWLKSSKGGVALFMIKLRSGRSEDKRITVGKSTTEWQKVEKIIDTTGSDNIQILCRYKQKANMIGSKCFFGKLKLTKE